jgi:adenylate kinase family enzyme
VQRVSVLGNSGSGKSWIARRIAEGIGAPYVELDDINELWSGSSPDHAHLHFVRLRSRRDVTSWLAALRHGHAV